MGVTAGIVEFADLNDASQEGPHLVRLKKAYLRHRISGQLTLRYEAGGLTSFAGLELIGRYIRCLDFRGTLRGVERVLPRSNFDSVRLAMLVLAMLMAGARRVRNVCYLTNDALVERLYGLPVCQFGTPWGAGCADPKPEESKRCLKSTSAS